MAWQYVTYEYPIANLFHKELLWLDKNCNLYFAFKLNSTDSWTFFAGDGSHALLSGEILTNYGSSEVNAQTNYLTTTRDSNGKVLAILPINTQAKYARVYIESGDTVTIHEWKPSTYITAHEIISGELTITDQLSSAPLIKVISSSVDRLKIGNIYGSTYGIVGFNDTSATVFELSNSRKNIAGWDFTASKLTSDNILIDSVNSKIESVPYVSGIAGTGFTLQKNFFEVGNAHIRGILRTAVFEKGVVSVVGGNVVVLPGDVLATSMSAVDNSTLAIEGNETFGIGDFLRIKDGMDDEWLEVTASSNHVYTVTRDKDAQYGANVNPAWKIGASVANYGVSGKGGILLTSSESNAPYLSMFTHAGTPWDAITTRLRLGNLNGSYGYSSEIYGLGVGLYGVASNTWLTVDTTNGFRIGNNTTIIGQWDASGNIFVGNQAAEHVKVSSSGTQIYDAAILYATYGATTTIGLTASEHISISSTAVQFKDGATVLTEVSGGNILIGQTGAGQSNVYITSGAIQFRNNVTSVITISNAGVAAITINTGGNITINDGGDIILQADDADPSMIIWKDGATVVDNFAARISGDYAAGTAFWPETVNTRRFYLGVDILALAMKPYERILFISFESFASLTRYDINNYAQVGCEAGVSGSNLIDLTIANGGSKVIAQLDIISAINAFYPFDGVIDLGRTGSRWRNLFLSGYVQITDYLCAEGGIHVGGTSDPGTDNLLVDGTLGLGSAATAKLTIKQPSDDISGGIVLFASASADGGGFFREAGANGNMVVRNQGINTVYINNGLLGVGITPAYKFHVYANIDAAYACRVENIHATGWGLLVVAGTAADDPIAAFYNDAAANLRFALYADGSTSGFCPDITKDMEISDPTPEDHLNWALSDAKKPRRPDDWTGDRITERELYGKDWLKMSIGTAIWAEEARAKIKVLEEEIKKLKAA